MQTRQVNKIVRFNLFLALSFGLLIACATTTSSESFAPSTIPALSAGGMTVTAPLLQQSELIRRPCSPIEYEQQTGREPRPQIEAGWQSNGPFYVAGGCVP